MYFQKSLVQVGRTALFEYFLGAFSQERSKPARLCGVRKTRDEEVVQPLTIARKGTG